MMNKIPEQDMASAQKSYQRYLSLKEANESEAAILVLLEAVRLDPYDENIADAGDIVLNDIKKQALDLFNTHHYSESYELAKEYVVLDKLRLNSPLLIRMNRAIERMEKFRKNVEGMMLDAANSKVSPADRIDSYNRVIRKVRNDDPIHKDEKKTMQEEREALIPKYKTTLIKEVKDLCKQAADTKDYLEITDKTKTVDEIKAEYEPVFKKAKDKAQEGSNLVPEDEAFEGIVIYVDCCSRLATTRNPKEGAVEQCEAISEQDDEFRNLFFSFQAAYAISTLMRNFTTASKLGNLEEMRDCVNRASCLDRTYPAEYENMRLAYEVYQSEAWEQRFDRALNKNDYVLALEYLGNQYLAKFKDDVKIYADCVDKFTKALRHEFNKAHRDEDENEMVRLLSPQLLGRFNDVASACQQILNKFRTKLENAKRTAELVAIEIMERCSGNAELATETDRENFEKFRFMLKKTILTSDNQNDRNTFLLNLHRRYNDMKLQFENPLWEDEEKLNIFIEEVVSKLKASKCFKTEVKTIKRPFKKPTIKRLLKVSPEKFKSTNIDSIIRNKNDFFSPDKEASSSHEDTDTVGSNNSNSLSNSDGDSSSPSSSPKDERKQQKQAPQKRVRKKLPRRKVVSKVVGGPLHSNKKPPSDEPPSYNTLYGTKSATTITLQNTGSSF